MPSIFDFVNAPAVALFIQEELSNEIPYFGHTIFPARRIDGMTVDWLKAAEGLPVTIQPSNFDAKATLREREGFGHMSTELAFFREAMRVGEKDRQKINLLLNNAQSALILPIVHRIFNDIRRLYDGVEAQAEAMRMELIQTGKITVRGTTNGAWFDYDYKMQNIFDAPKGWDDPESNPIEDIMDIQDKIEEDTGTRPTRLVMNRNTFKKLMENPRLRGLLLPMWDEQHVARALITDNQIRDYIFQVTGCRILEYSKKVARLNVDGLKGEEVKLVEDGNVIFLPEGTVGHTWYGVTPEEADLLSGASDAQVSVVGNGVAITSIREAHPVNTQTIVSCVMIPTFEGIDEVAVLHV